MTMPMITLVVVVVNYAHTTILYTPKVVATLTEILSIHKDFTCISGEHSVYYTYENTIQQHNKQTNAITHSTGIRLSMLGELIMCEQCEALTINGVYCHEQGCPDKWKTEKRECVWCGTEFIPEYGHQTHCSVECIDADFGQ